MELNYALHRAKGSFWLISSLAGLLILSLIANSILAGFAWELKDKTQIVVVPAVLKTPISLSQIKVNTAYLQQMALTFVNERLNVTPETIEASHQLLLQYTSPQFHSAFKRLLDKESIFVRTHKVSSVFYVSRIKVDPQNFTAVIQGDLKRWMGYRLLGETLKTYRLTFQYEGVLSITDFSEMKSHA